MIKKIYDVCPSGIQSALVSFYGYLNDRRRYSYPFDQCLGELLDNDRLSSEELRRFQKNKLQKFLRHSVKSPFWESRFRQYGVDVDGDPYEQISKLPVLKKEEVRDKVDEIHIPRKGSYRISTSGSTGAGLLFWGDRESEAWQWATWWRYRYRYGIKRDTWCGHFGGKVAVPVSCQRPPFCRVNYSSKQVMFSAYHLSADTVKSYVQEINERALTWIHGWPSLISELSRLALRSGCRLNHKISWVTLGSENITKNQQRVIHEFFGVAPVQHYGLAEGVANFSNTPGASFLSVDEDYAFAEFLEVEGGHKVVGTNYTNYSFPLIRYDTSDSVAEVVETSLPRKVLGLDGREGDVVVTPEGRTVGRLGYVFNDFTDIDEAQIVQRDMSSLSIKIVRNHRWKDSSEKQVADRLREKLGSSILIEFDYVDSVEKTASGKVRFIISKV